MKVVWRNTHAAGIIPALLFGKDKKGRSSLSCRIYDKTREIEQSGKAWVYDLWRAHGWSEDRWHGVAGRSLLQAGCAA